MGGIISMAKSTTLTRLEINLDLLKYNYKLTKDYVSPAEVSVVVKGNAYGHGAPKVVKTLIEEGCNKFWVANLVEGIQLRKAGINNDVTEINILGGLTPVQLKEALKYDLIPFIPDVERLETIDQIANNMNKVAKFYLKLDTGLGRLGLFPKDINEFCNKLDKLKRVQLLGVGSHLAFSDMIHPLNELQYKRFEEAVSYLKGRYGSTIKAHLSGSIAVIRFPKMNFDMVRTGSMIFGLSHFEENPIPIKPVLSYKTIIVQIKEVPAGWNIGYGENYAQEPRLIALLPVGLVDGLSSMHNKKGSANVLIHSVKCPIVSITSDQSMVDITEVEEDVQVGDEAVLIGSQGSKEITARELGFQADTNYAEILMKISPRVPRLYYKEGNLVGMESII
jgi:alanine racemase